MRDPETATDGGAIATASTVKETPEGVERFLRRNLSSGVDHMFVFLDSGQPRVRKMLEEHPHVTVIRTGPDYWNGARPERISDRARININLANAVCATVRSIGWLFHIDADEALSFDRDELLGRDVRAVRFPVWEAVSQATWPEGEPTLFKRKPKDPQLNALAMLGAIESPELEAYYRGHQEGKAGARPDLGLRFKVHAVEDQLGRGVRMATPAGMHLLHYESWCLADFVQRWRDYSPAQVDLRTHREARKRIGMAVHTITRRVKDEGERDLLLRRLYECNVADDLEALGALGLLAEPPVRPHRPLVLPSEDLEHIRVMVDALRPAPKDVFNDGGSAADIATVLDDATRRMPFDAARSVGLVKAAVADIDPS